MNFRTVRPLSACLAVRGLILPAMLVAPAAAVAQDRTISLPAMPLGDALRRIAEITGRPIDIDPDAVAGQTSSPVVNARNADDAIRQATRKAPVALERRDGGDIAVVNDIVVVANRDEAETNVMVRGSTTSSRLGQSLREQARNTQVISAKTLEEQQAQTVAEALRNAGGVVVNSATLQSGVGYSVRGFSSNGSVNGLPTSASSNFAAGATQPLANVERIEVLKGPDAILLGSDNLGGTVNIVTKKPYAGERLYVTAEIGSFGNARGTLDANQTLSDDRRWSARIIATAAKADRNFGGFRGNEDYLFAPSLRYKYAGTDVVLAASASDQIFGATPYTLFDTANRRPFPLGFGRPLLGGKDQYIRVGTTQLNADITQKVADWLTVAMRGQHQDASLALSQYSPYAILSPVGDLLVSSLGVRQRSKTDAIDAFARIDFKTGLLTHRIGGGATHIDNQVTVDNAQNGAFAPYNFLNPQRPLDPLATRYTFGFQTERNQTGYYGQYLLGFWKVHLVAGVRHNKADFSSQVGTRPALLQSADSTTPNFGAVVDVTDAISVFGTFAYGFVPTLVTDRLGNPLPDIDTRNAETGVKLDLFGDRMLVNASWFKIRQSNLLVSDPINPRFQVAVPGQQGEGIDLNVGGQPIKGLSVTAAYTRTKYSFLTPSTLGNVVQAQPRDVYSVYGSYRHAVTEKVTAGLGAGVYGRSSSAIDRRGVNIIPGAFQADLNAFLTIGRLDLNLGVRNVTDRRNFGPTIGTSFVPLSEPRTWRLTIGYRFW